MSGSAVLSAGLASAVAALVTSRFGVAGTLLGAALTTMIITGGSAVLKSYLEGVTGRVRKVPGKFRGRGGRMRSPQAAPQTLPARPDLRNNLVGRLRGAFDWFLRLSPLRRRAILAGAIVPTVVAFLISMGAITGLELAIGNSLTCGLYDKCPVAADGSLVKEKPTLAGAGAKIGSAAQDQQVQDFQQTPGQPDVQPEVDPNVQPGADPSVQPGADPGAQPATPEPVVPDSGTPGAGDQQAIPETPAPSDQVAPAPETPAPSE